MHGKHKSDWVVQTGLLGSRETNQIFELGTLWLILVFSGLGWNSESINGGFTFRSVLIIEEDLIDVVVIDVSYVC